jgi:hypothetical protein
MKRWRCPKRRVIPLAEQRLMASELADHRDQGGTPLDALLHPMDEPYEGIPDERPTGGSSCTLPNSFSHRSSRPGFGCCWTEFESIPALVARAFLALWMVFFSAVDAVAGIATGVLTRHANRLAGEDREGVVAAIDFLLERQSARAGGGFSVLGNLVHFSWVVVSIAATVALYRTGVSRVVVGATFCQCSSQPTPASGLQSG